MEETAIARQKNGGGGREKIFNRVTESQSWMGPGGLLALNVKS